MAERILHERQTIQMTDNATPPETTHLPMYMQAYTHVNI